MKNRLISTSVREIKNSFPRFLSLLIMSLLGMFCFVGLRSTAPDMNMTLDHYLDHQNTFDLKLTSPLGFSEESIKIIQSVEEVQIVEGAYSQDVLITTDENKFVLNIANLTSNINNVELLEGRLPSSSKEIVVEEAFLQKSIYKIGDNVTLETETGDIELQIVGTIRSPLYFSSVEVSNVRGSSQIGAGSVNFYSFVQNDFFENEYYSSIYITIYGAKEFQTNSHDYNELIKKAKIKIDEKIKEIAILHKKDFIDSSKKKLEQVELYLKNLNSQIDQELEIENLTRENLNVTITALENRVVVLGDYSVLEQLTKLKQIQQAIYEIENQEMIYTKSLETLQELENLTDEDFLKSIYTTTCETRLNWKTYADYINDTASVDNLSFVFPIVFFVVAVLISLISMNRMVEDDRGMIGTLKSLGFSNYHIMLKYLIFSSLAVLIGGLLGAGLGMIILPNLIFSIYGLLFDLPYFILKVNYLATLIGFVISTICICGTTILTIQKVLHEKSSQLLRPRAPKDGKRVFLEKFKFWSKLKFSRKITIRNLFRYKKRILITIGGITGCTALVLCGFGLRDSIIDIPSQQYKNVFHYDALVYLNLQSEKEKETIFSNIPEIKDVIACNMISSKVGDYNVSLVIPDDLDNFKKAINIVDLHGNPLELVNNKAIISDKLAELMHLHKGNQVTFLDQKKNSQTLEISGVMENYAQHFVLINKETLKNIQGEYKSSVVFLNFNRDLIKDYDKLTEQLMKINQVVSVTMVESFIDMVDDMLQSLNKVVVILIVLASILSFVVMYNISNININERKREIATLKVLGFYHHEVDNYITKENIILTLIGIIFGLVLGFFLTNFVVTTVEIESIRFIHQISPLSFIISSLITITFTYIVNIITHFSLKKIDMIESLKSVE